MFEEVAIWTKLQSHVAVIYRGFRRLDSGAVWIAFSNYVTFSEEETVSASQLIASNATLDAFLNELPQDDHSWTATMAEAVELFRKRNPHA